MMGIMRRERSAVGRLSLAVVPCLVVALGVLAVGGDTPAAAQGSGRRRPPSFGAGVEVIRLSVSVTDGRSSFVTGLSETDFAVFEDGVRQQLAFFERDPLPLSVSLLIDCSASMDETLPVAQEAGVRFLETLRPGDLAQIVGFNDRTQVRQDFTADRGALAAALRSTHASGPTALYTALYVVMKELARQGTAAAPRRRAIVLLSDGEDTTSLVNDDQVLELARQTEVAVHSIGLRPVRVPERSREAFDRAAHFLTALAHETGGQVHFTSALPELGSVYGRIADDLRTQYTLGYVSGNGQRDGRWRRIVVRTPARDSVQVRHKLGYYAPRG
jgi:Ca-activated chloride channel homolog